MPKSINDMLKDKFGARYADAAVRHFTGMVRDYQQREWADANTKAGRFIEAVLKALWEEAGEVVPKGRSFKAGAILDTIDKKMALQDSLRLTVPRACRWVYEIASNRGARHDADEVEANEMDASAVQALCSWILAEMVSYSQKGLDLAEAKAVVDSVVKRRYPFIEEIDGRVYADIAGGAREAAILILWHVYPKRITEADLFDQLRRHQYKKANAEMAIKRVQSFVDNDGGKLRLRNIGIQKAEQLIEKASQED
jgi:hypothetical protein